MELDPATRAAKLSVSDQFALINSWGISQDLYDTDENGVKIEKGEGTEEEYQQKLVEAFWRWV